MSIHPAARSTRPAPPRPPDRASRDLTVNKVIAGAGAAATSAVLGSFFGAAGTVAGAALGSVASTVATTIYQRSLDRTRDSLAARIRPMRAGPPGRPTLPVPRAASGDETVRLRVEPVVSPPPRRRWVRWVGATVLVFVIGLLAVTGIEWAKGSTLIGGDSGTSVGRVLGPDHGAPAATTDPAGRSADPTTAPDPTTDPPATSVPGLGPDGSGSGGSGGSQVPLLPGLVGGSAG
jgi:hypothetical protein